MALRKNLHQYLALCNYVEAFRSNVLPDGYTQLEYIESSGTQYIDTGIKGNGTTKVHIKTRYYTTTSTGGSGRIFGSRDAAAVNAFAVGSASGTASTSSTVAFFFGNQSYLVTDKPIILDEWLDIVFDKTTHNINGVDYGDPYNDETFETPQTLKIFGFDNSGTMGVGYVDITYCQLWNNNILVRNFIPAKRNSDNVIGMYDTVSNRFFTNQGTGNFIAGPNVSKTPYSNKVYLEDSIKDGLSSLNVYGKAIQSNIPEGYTELEYLQSDGASYLIVPYRVNNKTVFYCRYNAVQKGPQTADAVFGVTDSPTTNIAYNGILRLIGASFNRMGWGDNTIGSVIDVPTAPKDFDIWYEVLYDQNELYQDGTLYATSATDPSTVWSANYDLGIFARKGSTVTMPAIVKISSVWAKEDGEYKINLVPAKRNNDNVLGMYDKVSGQFFTNEGTGAFVAGPEVVLTPDNPIDIYCSNGVIKYSANLANVNEQTALIGYYISAQGVVTADANNWIYQDYIPVKPNTKYTLSIDIPVYYVTISEYSTNADSGFIRRNAGVSGSNISLTITTDATTNFIRFGTNVDRNAVTLDEILGMKWMLNMGDVMPYTPYSPISIYVDGTPEKLNIKGNNLYDITKDITGKFIGENGSIGDEPYSCYSDLIPVKEGESYTYSGICNVGSASTANNKRIHGYVNGVWNRQIAVISVNKNTPFYTTFTIPAGINGIRISHWTDDSNTQLEECYRPTKYNNYIDMNLDVANLLSVGDYTDSQDILNGVINRQLGVLVLDGTENWSLATSTNLVQFYTSSTQGIIANSVSLTSTIAPYGCTAATRTQYDFGCYSGASGNLCFQMKGSATLTTVSAWTQYLADQFAARTPVIVIYPLATPTTESVTSQTTLLSSNNNVIIRDSEYINDLGLDLTYKKLR